jgi:hypothetical protein
VDGGRRGDRVGLVLVSDEEPFGFLEPPLEDAQLGELGDRMDASGSVPRRLERLDRRGQPSLRLGERPGRLHHLGATRAAEREEGRVVMPFEVALDHLVPTHQAGDLAGLLAGSRHEAADVAEHERVGDLARGRGGHRLVQRCHAVVDVAGQDQRPPEQRERRGLQVGVSVGASALEGGLGAFSHGAGLVRQRSDRQIEPPARAGCGLVAQQSGRASEPPARRRRVPERLDVLAGDPQRDERRAIRVARPAVKGICAFALVECVVDVADPPQRAAESVTRVGRLDAFECRGERVAGRLEVAGREGLLAPDAEFGLGRDRHGPMMDRFSRAVERGDVGGSSHLRPHRSPDRRRRVGSSHAKREEPTHPAPLSAIQPDIVVRARRTPRSSRPRSPLRRPWLRRRSWSP